MNLKQKKARAKKIFSKNIELRKEFWPQITSDSLWNRKLNDGFTTMPRPMPHILKIMDYLADKGKPVFHVYLSLWCRVFDESLVVIQNEKDMAFEAGFTGQRAVTTWHSRMKNLVDLGFIEAKPGSSGKYNYVLIFNPYFVIKKLNKAKKISEELYNALFARAQDVGANDLKTGN
jgi:hypothetical protein